MATAAALACETSATFESISVCSLTRGGAVSFGGGATTTEVAGASRVDACLFSSAIASSLRRRDSRNCVWIFVACFSSMCAYSASRRYLRGDAAVRAPARRGRREGAAGGGGGGRRCGKGGARGGQR